MVKFDDAFDGLYRSTYRVAFRLTGDRALAEDVVQETLARALVRWLSIENRASGWCSTVATNLVLDAFRRRSRRWPRGEHRSPDHATYTAERLDLQSALADLPRRQREVVVMRYLADLPEATVAAALGCSVGTVKQHAHRGLRSLRRVMPLPEERDDV